MLQRPVRIFQSLLTADHTDKDLIYPILTANMLSERPQDSVRSSPVTCDRYICLIASYIYATWSDGVGLIYSLGMTLCTLS